MGKPDGRSQESESLTGTHRLERASQAVRSSHRGRIVAPVLLALLLAAVIGCEGAATNPPEATTETPGGTGAPTALAETDALASTSAPAMLEETPAPTNSPTVPTETPATVIAPDVPAETPAATAPPTQQPPAASPTPVTATATATAPATATVPPTATPAPIQGPVVKIGDALFPVDLALTPEQRSQGLSGREVMAADTGMLFIFDNEGNLTFWMKEMHFPLDIVWIGADCTVADVTLGAPPPEEGQALADLPRFSPSSPAQYVLEINAG